jgi:2-polyprenyl-3-methyl-5-hydroxy-6-metoxy-1,4-benzoquinol methylase
MDQDYLKLVKENIDSKNPLLQVQRSPEATIYDFLFEVGYYIKLLRPNLKENNNLCNVGCGNGLINLVLHPFYKKIVNIDPIEDMLRKCREYCRNLSNLEYLCEYGQNIHKHFSEEEFHDVICIGVATRVPSKDEFYAILEAIAKVVKRPGRVVLGCIPDSKKRDSYLEFLPDILLKKGFSNEKIEKIVIRNQESPYYSSVVISNCLTKLGAKQISYHCAPVQYVGHEVLFSVVAEF